MKLLIVESPGKIQKLTAILGDGWKVAASIGHVRDLPLNEIGIEPPDFMPKYEPTERGAKVIANLKILVKQAEVVYLGTDPDREGEAISWHLQQCLGLRKPLRVTFGEITPKTVLSAIATPREIDLHWVAAQESRRVLDRLVGYMVSPELSQQAGERLSAGRVQSPAVWLVVERERAIQNFKSTTHFGAALFFAGAKLDEEWFAEWRTKPKFTNETTPYFLDKNFANAVALVKTATVQAFIESESKRSPPPPFTTSMLQQAASVALQLDPKATMDAAQKLYEQGHITYHRTDNPNVSDESLPDIHTIAAKLGVDIADTPRKFKAPPDAQAGHPAITPTHWDVVAAGETEQQQALYKLIRLRAIACQLADARYAVRTVVLDATVEAQPVEFEGRGKTLTYPGWLKLIAGDQTEDDEDKEKESPNPIPFLEIGESVTVLRGKLLEKKTIAPGRYTQASLVKKLESEGIGRPATYAAIMDNIVSREYIKNNKRHLVPTATGELVIDRLSGKFQFLDLGFTRNVNTELDRIADGQNDFKSLVTQIYRQLTQELSTFRSTFKPKHPCPECGLSLRRIPYKQGHFWGCSGHPHCSVTLPDDDGKPGQRKAQEVSKYVCTKCSKPLVHREKTGRGGYDFWGCSGYRDGCRETYENKNGKPVYAQTKT